MFVFKEISDTFFPLTIMKLIFGIGVIEYPLGCPRNTLSLIYSAFSFSLAGVSSIIYKQGYHQTYGAKRNTVALLFQNIFVYGNLIFYLIAIIMERTYRKEFQQCFQKINILNKQFGTIGIREKYAKVFIKNLSYIAILIILIAYYTIRILVVMPRRLLLDVKMSQFLTFVYLSNVPMTVECHFLALISYLRVKFQQLNNSLKKLTGCDSLSMQFEKVVYYKIGLMRAANLRLGRKTTDDVKILRTAKELHLDLVKICEKINEIFGFQLFLSIGVSVGILTTAVLDLYRNSFLPLPKNQERNHLTGTIFMILLYTIRILAVNHVCYTASEEASNTEIIVCDLHEPSTNSEFREELDEFILQLKENPLIFTAHGFFTLNHNFIQRIAGIVTTYLVIIVQFQIDSEQS